jgi:NitT/TauT family transport system substrate-binding protein
MRAVLRFGLIAVIVLGVAVAKADRIRVAVHAPPLLSQKALQGETDATLTYWNFCAELENRGFSRAIAMEDVARGLGAKWPFALVGYAFDGTWAGRNTSTLERFLAAVHQAKEILAQSEMEWQRLAPNLRLGDANAVAIYRQRYSEIYWFSSGMFFASGGLGMDCR